MSERYDPRKLIHDLAVVGQRSFRTTPRRHGAHRHGRVPAALVVREMGWAQGPQRRIDDPDGAGHRVAGDRASTTSGSVHLAVDALRDVGADVVGTTVVVDRGVGSVPRVAGLKFRSAFSLTDLGLPA